MSCKTESKTIGEHEFSVTQWPAEKSLIMKFRLTKVFGASLASFASLVKDTKEKNSSVEKQAKVLSDSLSILFKDNSPQEIVALLKDCVISVGCDGTKITPAKFDELFSGDDLLLVYQVFIFVLQVNYSGFMKGQLAERLLAKMKESL